MKSLVIVFLGVSLVLSSFVACGRSETLTREKAKEILSKKYPQPIQSILYKTIDNVPPGHFDFTKHNQMVNEGLINIFESNRRTYPILEIDYVIVLTPKGKAFVIGEESKLFCYVKVGEVILGDITGIALDPSGRMAMVEYNVREEYTPFARFLLDNTPNAGKNIKQQASFTLYDDGWRM